MAHLKVPAAVAGFASTTGDRKWRPQQEPLYGREDDIRMVCGLLHEHTQVSIVGAGGIGKTRLAQAVATAQREHSPDALWWIDLAALNDTSWSLAQSRKRLACVQSGERPLLETVIAVLSGSERAASVRQL